MGRAERRRAQRREQQANRLQKQAQAVRDMKLNERIIRYSQNGITPDDLQNAIDQAKNEAHIEGWCSAIAAFSIALHDMHGFGRDRCAAVTERAYQELMTMCDNDELIQKTIDKIGFYVDFEDPLQPIRLREVKRSRKKRDGGNDNG